MKIYPTEYTITVDDDTTFAKFKAFDEESVEVEFKAICNPDDLRTLADMLEVALDKLKHGETKHLNDECDGCICRPQTGDPFPEVCGLCSRFYGDGYSTAKDEE